MPSPLCYLSGPVKQCILEKLDIGLSEGSRGERIWMATLCSGSTSGFTLKKHSWCTQETVLGVGD